MEEVLDVEVGLVETKNHCLFSQIYKREIKSTMVQKVGYECRVGLDTTSFINYAMQGSTIFTSVGYGVSCSFALPCILYSS